MSSPDTPSSPSKHERNKSANGGSSNNHGATQAGDGQVELSKMPGPLPPLPIEEDLMALARLGELRSIQKLFDSGKYNANSADPQGITALHWAAINGHYALCHFLIQAGADVNAKGGDAEATPVLWASKKCNLEIVNLLLRNGADPLITDDQGYNLLHSATLDGNVFQLVLLLHEADIPIDVLDSQQHTSLMWAAYKGYPACMDVLLRWGADVHARDEQGFTALHWALVKGSYVCIQKLIEFGADRFAANNDGKTPATTAREMNSTRQWHRALADSGYDAEGNPLEFPIGMVKDTRKFIERFFFFWPFVVLGCTLWVLAWMPVYFGLPLSMVISYVLQWLGQRMLKWAPSDMKHMHKTPFLAGVFGASLFWVWVRYLTHILPATFSTNFLLNLAFVVFAALTSYYYFTAMFADPGYIPKSQSRGQQKALIEELLEHKAFNEQHFCTTCMIRKPLRSKHCRRCNRCVARNDHHCPWINNCVAINNHRTFVLYITALAIALVLLVRLTFVYLDVSPAPSPDTVQCTWLKDDLCSRYSIDPFTIVVSGWGAIQLTWTSMLVFVQLTQIARAMTTYESMKGAHAGPVTTALATGSMTTEGADVGSAGAGPDASSATGEASRPKHRKKEGCFSQWKRLLGLDTFVATALHGSKANEVLARRRANPFTKGVFRNCADFWCDYNVAADGRGKGNVVFGGKQQGYGLLGGEVVDYRKLYDLPRGGMRYRSGGYEGVEGEEV